MNNEDKNKEQYCRALGYLHQLGFPMDNYGTKIYLVMIWKIIKRINEVPEEKYETLLPFLLELKDPNSHFYKVIASIGDVTVKRLHTLIQESIDNINYENANMELYKELFARVYEDIDYGEFALLVASHVTGKIQQDTYINEEMPVVKHLTKEEK